MSSFALPIVGESIKEALTWQITNIHVFTVFAVKWYFNGWIQGIFFLLTKLPNRQYSFGFHVFPFEPPHLAATTVSWMFSQATFFFLVRAFFRVLKTVTVFVVPWLEFRCLDLVIFYCFSAALFSLCFPIGTVNFRNRAQRTKRASRVCRQSGRYVYMRFVPCISIYLCTKYAETNLNDA